MKLEDLRRAFADKYFVEPFICDDCGGDWYGADADGFYGAGDGKPRGECPMCHPVILPPPGFKQPIPDPSDRDDEK